MLNLSFPSAPTVRFGLSKGQKDKIEGIEDQYTQGIKDREYITSLKGTSITELAKRYAAENTPQDRLPFIEEALIDRFRQIQASCDNNIRKIGEVPLRLTVDALDSGRLEGKALPPILQNALAAAITAYNSMLTRP